MRSSWLPAILTVLVAALFGLPATAGAAAPAPLGNGSILFTANASARCTVAFAATRAGLGHLITGPGCAGPGVTLFSGNNIVVGPVIAAPVPAGGYSVVRVTNTVDWVLVPWVETGTGRVVLTGSRETPVGGSVCRLGRISGWRCGTVAAKNQTITFPWGTITGLTRTTACAEPGDTGAAFRTGNQAQGILLGGSGDCTTGGTTFFKPVNPILAANGLTLLTG